MPAHTRKLGIGDPAMRVKTAFVLAAGSACLLALSVTDFLYPPPRNHDRAMDADHGIPAEPVMPRHVVLPQQVRLPPPRPSRLAISQPVAGGLELIAEARKYLGTNPTHRRQLWCAAFMNFILAKLGYPGTHSDAARSFIHYGRRIRGPRIGAIAVLSRGKDGGHVGVVTGFDKHHNPILISGNFNRSVGIGVHARSRVIAYVEPIAHSSTAHSAQGSVSHSAKGRRRLMRRLATHHHRAHRVAGIKLDAAASQARAEVQGY
jgi:uncharacterized protein (TIGR02594 family)